MSMYRAALDQLLFEQGFTEGMTGQKVQDLRLAIDVAKGSQSMPVKRKTALPAAPVWALDLETEFLELLTQLGSGAIHPNDGDVDQQAILDATLLQRVRTAFRFLLYLAYEVEHEKQETLSQMCAGAAVLKRRPREKNASTAGTSSSELEQVP